MADDVFFFRYMVVYPGSVHGLLVLVLFPVRPLAADRSKHGQAQVFFDILLQDCTVSFKKLLNYSQTAYQDNAKCRAKQGISAVAGACFSSGTTPSSMIFGGTISMIHRYNWKRSLQRHPRDLLQEPGRIFRRNGKDTRYQTDYQCLSCSPAAHRSDQLQAC